MTKKKNSESTVESKNMQSIKTTSSTTEINPSGSPNQKSVYSTPSSTVKENDPNERYIEGISINTDNIGDETEKFVKDMSSIVHPSILKMIEAFMPIIIILIIVILSIIHGIQNHKHFDMSIIYYIVTNPAFIFIVLIFIIFVMYFKYASQVEQWYYYSIGSAGSTPPFYELFMAIVIFDVLIGIRISNKKGFLGAAESFFERGKKALEFAMAPVASIIMLIIYLIFTLLNIRLATAIFIIFLYVHSYFGMQLYAGSISDGYKEMTKMIYDALNSEGKECTSNGTLEQLSRRVLKYIYDNLVVFIFCTILFSGIFAYNDNMKSAGKNTFVMINVMILICIVLFKVVYAFLDKSEVGNIGDYDMPKL